MLFRSNRIRAALEAVDQLLSGLTEVRYSGQRAITLTSRYQRERDAIFNAPRVVTSFATNLEQAAMMFEKADQNATISDPAVQHSNINIPDWAINDLHTLGLIDLANKFIVSPAMLLAAIKTGTTYAGQVNVYGSEWYKFWMLGINSKFTNGTAETLLEGSSQLGTSAGAKFATGTIGAAFFLVGLVSDWVQDFDKYQDQGTGHVASAFVYDAAKAGVGIGAVKIGAIIGTAVCPGPGTVIGGAVGGIVAEGIFGDTIWGFFGKPNPIKEWAIDQMASVGESSGIVSTIDQQLAQTFGTM